jgi:hypothetical protein
MSTLQRYIGSALGVGTLLVITPACADQGPAVGDCSSLRVTVSRGTSPTFSWNAECQVEEVVVALPGPGAVVWSAVSVNQSNSIASPVVYASTPPGAAMTANLVQFLVAGTTYQATLLRRADGPGGQIEAAGTATFVP